MWRLKISRRVDKKCVVEVLDFETERETREVAKKAEDWDRIEIWKV